MLKLNLYTLYNRVIYLHCFIYVLHMTNNGRAGQRQVWISIRWFPSVGSWLQCSTDGSVIGTQPCAFHRCSQINLGHDKWNAVGGRKREGGENLQYHAGPYSVQPKAFFLINHRRGGKITLISYASDNTQGPQAGTMHKSVWRSNPLNYISS